MKLKIGTKYIGSGEPCFIIAEAGSNHNGNLAQAKKLIDVAVDAGADAVKFQLFKADHLYPKGSGNADYLKDDTSIYEIIKNMELPEEWLPELSEYCKQKQIVFLASVFDEALVDVLDPFVCAYKTASYEITHLPLLKHIAEKQKPIIIATGCCTTKEVEEAVDVIRATGNNNYCILQCTARYPAPIDATNLKVLDTFREKFRVPVGVSDHSREPLIVPLAAAARGANIIEKHFTLSNFMPGPDHKFAVEPRDLKNMVDAIRKVEETLGDGIKRVAACEEELYEFARRYVYTVRDIKKGEIFSKANVRVLRSGDLPTGILPKYWSNLLGIIAGRNIDKFSPVLEEDLNT